MSEFKSLHFCLTEKLLLKEATRESPKYEPCLRQDKGLMTVPPPGRYLAARRWISAPACLRSRWRSAGGTWCGRRRGSCGSARRQSRSSAARSLLPPPAPARRRPAGRRAARLLRDHSGSDWVRVAGLMKVECFTLSVSCLDKGWYLRRRALATCTTGQLDYTAATLW